MQKDGDLTDKIVITKNTVDTSKAGKYTVVYEVTDSHGIRVVRTIYVTVQQKTADTNKKDSQKRYSSNKYTDKYFSLVCIGNSFSGSFISCIVQT